MGGGAKTILTCVRTASCDIQNTYKRAEYINVALNAYGCFRVYAPKNVAVVLLLFKYAKINKRHICEANMYSMKGKI